MEVVENLGPFFGIVVVAVVFAALVSPVHSWGKEGHIATCQLAEPLLSEAAKKAVKDLLPDYAKGDFPSLCPWADYIRFHYHWSSPLHFIDVVDDSCTYVYSRDCHDTHGVRGRCLHGAILNYTSQLKSYGKKSHYNLTEALLFLSHFMGDIHQPLHCGHISDGGGTKIHLHWYRRKATLHQIWDTLMIDTALKDFYDRDLEVMVQAIQLNITGSWSNDVSKWEKCGRRDPPCPGAYAKESVSLACKFAYKDVEENITLGDDYFFSRLPVLEKQLAKGGVRLAATLNKIFGSSDLFKPVETE